MGSGWSVIVPVKGGERAKSRLGAEGPRLASAMAGDLLEALRRSGSVTRTLVVGCWAGEPPDGVELLACPPGLTGAVRAGMRALDGGPVLVLPADLPCVQAADVVALTGLVEHEWHYPRQVFVPDAAGTGTVALAACSPSALTPRFGPDSAARHREQGADPVGLSLTRLRRDVDTWADMRAATALGVGPRTADALRGLERGRRTAG